MCWCRAQCNSPGLYLVEQVRREVGLFAGSALCTARKAIKPQTIYLQNEVIHGQYLSSLRFRPIC